MCSALCPSNEFELIFMCFNKHHHFHYLSFSPSLSLSFMHANNMYNKQTNTILFQFRSMMWIHALQLLLLLHCMSHSTVFMHKCIVIILTKVSLYEATFHAALSAFYTFVCVKMFRLCLVERSNNNKNNNNQSKREVIWEKERERANIRRKGSFVIAEIQNFNMHCMAITITNIQNQHNVMFRA